MTITAETCIAVAVLCDKPIQVVRNSTTGQTTIHTLKMKVWWDEHRQVIIAHFSDNTLATIPKADFDRNANRKLLELRKTVMG